MTRRNRWLFAAILSAAALPAVHGQAASDAFERWTAAVGGRERLTQVTGVYREATIEIAGFTGTIRAWHTADGRYRKEEHVASVSTVETFDGVHGMAQQGAIAPAAIVGSELERMRSMPFANWNAVFFALFPGRLQGTRSSNGDGILLRPDGGIDWHVTLDPSTGLPATMTHQEGGRTVIVTFVSYETIDGLRFEHEIRRSNGNPQFNALITFTKTVINPPLESSLFHQE
jgi:hypothetical protein